MAMKKDLTPAQRELQKALHESEDLAPLFADAWRKVIGEELNASGWEAEFKFLEHVAHPRGWRFDFAHRLLRVAVEVDGGQRLAKISPRTGKPVAVGRHASDEDHWKIATAVADGWKVFQFTPTMLTRDPFQCVKLVALACYPIYKHDIEKHEGRKDE